MGQYYKIINVDKKQTIYPFDYGNGLKLMEWSYDRNDIVLVLLNQLGNEWKGDRVYVVGDYAGTENPDESWCAALDSAQKELECESLYEISDEFTRVVPGQITSCCKHGKGPTPIIIGSTEDNGYRYIYNHATRQVIDLKKCPIEWTWFDDETKKVFATRIAPLPLLLAMGNGRGCGDYRQAENMKLVGSWCGTSASIEVTKEPLESARDYDEFAPDFTERKEIVPYTKLDEVIAAEVKKHVTGEGESQ